MARKFTDETPLSKFGDPSDPDEQAAVHFFMDLCRRTPQAEITARSIGAGLNLPARALDFRSFTDPVMRQILRGRAVRIDGTIQYLETVRPYENPHGITEITGCSIARVNADGRKEAYFVYLLEPGGAQVGDAVLVDAYFLKWVNSRGQDGSLVTRPLLLGRGFTFRCGPYRGPPDDAARARLAEAFLRIEAVPAADLEKTSVGSRMNLPYRPIRYETLLDPSAEALLQGRPVQVDGLVTSAEVVPDPSAGEEAPPVTLCRIERRGARGEFIPFLVYLREGAGAERSRYIRLHGIFAGWATEPHESGVPVRIPVFAARGVAESFEDIPWASGRRERGGWLVLAASVAGVLGIAIVAIVWTDRRRERDFQTRVWAKIYKKEHKPIPPRPSAPPSPPAPPEGPTPGP
ncbi:MAG: hypothetical protein HY608_09395 [Planctomycetes bacterium]|nr:hypothetical protein [Planctomycetota bacterium]